MRDNNISTGKLLFVENNSDTAAHTAKYLQSDGFNVYFADTENFALRLVKNHDFDMVILNTSLTKDGGYSLCKDIKSCKDIPVIFISPRADEYSVVKGFDMGADDYIPLPFRPLELISRVKSVLRLSGKRQAFLEFGDLKVDTSKGLVTKGGKEIFLSALEYRILLVFLQNKGKVMPRQRLLQEIWDIGGEFVSDNTLTVYIKRIREKIERDPKAPTVIKTVRGVGYKMEE